MLSITLTFQNWLPKSKVEGCNVEFLQVLRDATEMLLIWNALILSFFFYSCGENIYLV